MAVDLEDLAQRPDEEVPPAREVMPAVLGRMAENTTEAAKGHAGTTVAWRFDDGATYHLRFEEHGGATWGEGTGEGPRLTFVTSPATWVKMVAGKLDGMQAFMTGKLRIEGDIMFAQQFQTLFNRPA